MGSKRKGQLAPVYDARHVVELLGFTGVTVEDFEKLSPCPEPIEGWFTFFDPGWSILQLRHGTKDWTVRIFGPGGDWYDGEPFAQATEHHQYRRLRIGGNHALAPNERIPSARVLCMAFAIHKLDTESGLMPHKDVISCDRKGEETITVACAGGSISLGHGTAKESPFLGQCTEMIL
jgi:hypothetical protein